jgi:pimeloyl-ACP methyl ester carboxylesterase
MPQLKGVEHRFVEVGGLRMHVAEAGEGEPVLMLHGWPQHWWEWRHVIPLLADRHRVICPDLRGFGWSDAPPDGYEKQRLADDVLGLLDELELERVQLVGHDWGGWIGFILCLREPERFESFLALNIPHPWQRFDLRRLVTGWRLLYQVVLASPLGERLVRRKDVIARALRAGAAHPEAWSEADIEAFAAPLREPERARATKLMYRTFLLREFAKTARTRDRLHVTTRMLFGKRDVVIRESWLEGYEPYADDMTVEVVPDSGHFIADEKPELVAQRALELFS